MKENEARLEIQAIATNIFKVSSNELRTKIDSSTSYGTSYKPLVNFVWLFSFYAFKKNKNQMVRKRTIRKTYYGNFPTHNVLGKKMHTIR